MQQVATRALRATPLPPGWDEAVDLDATPATIPDPADGRRAGRAARRDRAADGALPRPPLRDAAGARRRPARARLVLARGDPPGRRRDAGHARLPVERRDLLRHAAHRAQRAAATCTSARAWPATCATRRRSTTRSPSEAEAQGLEDVELREFECLGACDMAPMASVDGRYVGPLSTDDAAEFVRQLKEGETVLPGRGLADPGFALPLPAPQPDGPHGAARRRTPAGGDVAGRPSSTCPPRARARHRTAEADHRAARSPGTSVIPEPRGGARSDRDARAARATSTSPISTRSTSTSASAATARCARRCSR